MKLVKRIGVAAVLIAVLAAALYFGGWVLCALFTAGAVMAAYEMGSALAKKELKPFMLPAYIFALLYFAAYRVFGGMGLWMVAMACILMAMADRIFTEARTAQDTMASMFVLVYPMSLFAAVAMLCEYGADADKSRIALLCAFAMPLMGDTLAYFGGRLLGKKKLCPRLSPNKTVAGSIFGFVGGGRLHTPTVTGVLDLCYLALLSALAFTIWSSLLQRCPLGSLGVFNFIIPVFGTLLSAVFLKEDILHWQYLVSLILVCAGIFLVNRKKVN